MTQPVTPYGPFTMTQVRHAFSAFDLDHNSFVGAAELRHVYTSIGEDVTDEEIDEMIRMVDTDGDGQVSEAEFAKMIFRYAPQIEEETEAEGKEEAKEPANASTITQGRTTEKKAALDACLHALEFRLSDAKSVFERYPTHEAANLERISIDIFADLMRRPRDEKLQHFFNLFDANGSGEIDAKEVLVLLTNYTDWPKEDKMKFVFDLFDVDKSKFLTEDELTRILKANWLAERGEQVKKKVQAILRQADKDNDHKVSFDEFVQVNKQFPNLLFPNWEAR